MDYNTKDYLLMERRFFTELHTTMVGWLKESRGIDHTTLEAHVLQIGDSRELAWLLAAPPVGEPAPFKGGLTHEEIKKLAAEEKMFIPLDRNGEEYILYILENNPSERNVYVFYLNLSGEGRLKDKYVFLLYGLDVSPETAEEVYRLADGCGKSVIIPAIENISSGGNIQGMEYEVTLED